MPDIESIKQQFFGFPGWAKVEKAHLEGDTDAVNRFISQIETPELERRYCLQQSKMLIDLDSQYDPVIIVPSRTGVVYHNQVRGNFCLQFYLEGYLVPVATRDESPEIFDPRYGLESYTGLSVEDVALIEDQINQAYMYSGPRQLKVIEHEDNGEAWIWVEFGLDGHDERLIGVLTWHNSD
jgi:Family of unknown function (DUF6210)